jgi:VanZ family protein
MRDREETSPGYLVLGQGLFPSMPPRVRVICAWMLVGLYASGIFVLSSLSHPPLVSTWRLQHLDKLYHALEYGGLTFVLIHALCLTRGARPSTRLVLAAAALAIVYGALDEFHQAFTPKRAMSVYDLLADATGASAIAGVWLGVQRRWPWSMLGKS